MSDELLEALDGAILDVAHLLAVVHHPPAVVEYLVELADVRHMDEVDKRVTPVAVVLPS